MRQVNDNNQNSSESQQVNNNNMTTPNQTPNKKKVDLNKSIYILLDLETTGRSSLRSKITEIASICLDTKGNIIDNSEYTSLVNPEVELDPKIVELTKITNAMLSSARTFDIVSADWIKHIVSIIQDYESKQKKKIVDIIFVAHNGKQLKFIFHFIK